MKLTKTEQLGYNWLQEQGNHPEEIIKNHKFLPDFTCAKGRYEVKKLVGRQISFTEYQFQNFQSDDTILVFNNNTLVLKFLWGERFQVPFKIHKQRLILRNLVKESKKSSVENTTKYAICSSSINQSGGSYILRLRKDMIEKFGWLENEKEVKIITSYDKKIFIVIDSKAVEPAIAKIFSELLEGGKNE